MASTISRLAELQMLNGNHLKKDVGCVSDSSRARSTAAETKTNRSVPLQHFSTFDIWAVSGRIVSCCYAAGSACTSVLILMNPIICAG